LTMRESEKKSKLKISFLNIRPPQVQRGQQEADVLVSRFKFKLFLTEEISDFFKLP